MAAHRWLFFTFKYDIWVFGSSSRCFSSFPLLFLPWLVVYIHARAHVRVYVTCVSYFTSQMETTDVKYDSFGGEVVVATHTHTQTHRAAHSNEGSTEGIQTHCNYRMFLWCIRKLQAYQINDSKPLRNTETLYDPAAVELRDKHGRWIAVAAHPFSCNCEDLGAN